MISEAAAYEADAGYADPTLTASGMANWAAQHGVDLALQQRRDHRGDRHVARQAVLADGQTDQGDRHVALTHDFVVKLLVRHELAIDEFLERKLPELQYKLRSTRILKTPFYLQVDSSLDYLERSGTCAGPLLAARPDCQ